MNEQITKLDPYEFLKSNIVYTDVKKAVLTEHIDQSTEDTYGSEKSYDVLVSHEDFLDIITFMTAKPLWNYVVAFANLFEYCIATYALAFDDTINREISILVARCICILMVVADIIFALLHYRWKEIRQRRIEPPRNKYLQIIDAITLISIFLIYMPFLGGLFIRKVICVILISIRLYRILIYYRRVSTTAGMNTKSYLLMKHGLIYVFIIHSFACLWKHEGMGSKELKETWMHKDSYLTTTKEQTVSNFNLYILSLLYVVGAVTSVAFGGGSALKNDTEKMILICLMLISFFYLYGMCLGSFTLVQVEKYRRQTQFINRFKMIVNNLEAHNISKVLRNKMLRYYVQFWKQDDAISHSTLFDKLPLAIRQQVLLDKFWFAIDEIHIFKYLHPGFKCKLACHMTARICIPGESIYNVGETCHKMIYIAKGSVNLLSTVDGQSPLLTLGVGTTLGKFNLVYSMKSSSNVVAATYCTIYILERRVLWKQISTYKQLLQAKIMHVNIKRIINQARAYHKQKEDTNDTHEYNLLQETKRMLRTENEYHIIDYTAKTSSDRRDKLSYIYVLSKRSNMNTDGIFIQTTWPWILNNESAFIDAWEICVVVAVLVCCIGYPYEIAFNRGFSNEYTLYRVLGDIIYLADVVIKLITAIETDQGLLTTSVQIGLNRLSQLSFLCDVLAIFPFHSLTYYSGISKQQRYLIILSALKLFKFYRIIGYLQKLEYNFKLNIAYIRLLKYVMFLLYPGYLMGCLYFMVLCFNEPCAQDMALANKTQNAVSYSIMTAMLIMSGTGGIVEFFSIQEVSIILSVSITGTLTIVYLVADYSATLTLAEREITMYSEMVSLMRKFMVTNNIVKQLQLRMNRYLIARWLDCKGMNYKDLYQDASKQLFEDFQIKKYSKILYTNPLFQHLHFNIIRKLAISCQSVSLPPNEYVCYAGEVSREMYIIENGYCELISGSSEMVEKILGPMNGFSIVDTLLELAGIFNVRTITHVRLLKLRLTSIKEALLIVPEMAQQVNELSEETRSSFAASRLFTISSSVISQCDIEEKGESWAVFSTNIVDPRYIDFLNGWTKFTLLKYMMLRRTILPDGKFILIWEVVRGISAFLSAIIFPVLYIYQHYVPNLNYYLLTLDVFGVIDIYIRLHVCYYNKSGILVTHPRMTAKNYLFSSFIVDLIATCPIDYIIYGVERKNTMTFHKLQTFIRFNRVLQIYRLPDAFSIFTKDCLKRQAVYLNALKYLLLTSVIMNLCAATILNISVVISDTGSGLKDITPISNSWIIQHQSSFSLNASEPLNMYFMALYWVTTTTLQLSFGSVNAEKNEEVLFVIIIIVTGYLWYTYVIVIISNSKATINAYLTLYQNHMRRFIQFMNEEKISKELRTKAIDHFEYIWQRTHGMDAINILKQCHIALRKDCALYLYEETLKQVTVFTDMLPSFYRMVGTIVSENYYLKNYSIIQLNDIVKYMYIIHKGEVLVIGPDGSYFETLTRGCLFGNLDDVNQTRSMVTILSNTNVDLLTIPAETFYFKVRDYPIIKNRIRNHILMENLSYIKTKTNKADVSLGDESVGLVKKKITRILSKSIMQCFFGALCWLSYALALYQLAFKSRSTAIFVTTYTLDLFYIIHICLRFHAFSQQRIAGQRKMVMSRRFAFEKFYDILSVLPLEVLSLFARRNKLYFFFLLRMNRAFRLWNIYYIFTISYNFLNVNVLLIKALSILVTMATIIHTETCIWYMIGENNVNGWMYNTQNQTTCVKNYLCSMYFAVSLSSFVGYMNIRPRTTGEITFTVFNTIVNKFIAAVVIGDMSSITKSYASTLTSFDHSRHKMELFLKNSYISMPLFNCVMQYTMQLWGMNQGYQVPIFMTQAPPYINASIKWAAFGHHIRENWVFMDCHTDFIRILIRKMHIQTYFTGDTICHQGDVNDRMFFIHKGKVNAYYITDTEEIHVDSLDQNDCFGMIQGLFPNTPHTHTFKAITVTSVLALKLSSWVHLLLFYPGSKFLIYDRISKLDLYAKGVFK